MTSRRVLGGVLVGGSSRRMGRPKQFIETRGGTLIERAVAALEPEVDEVVLLGGEAVPSTLADLRRLPDADGCRGPMAGVLSALRSDSEVCWVVVACDMPLIRPEAVRWLLGRRRHGATAVYPRINGHLEPLLAAYEPAARLHLETASREGRFSLQILPTVAEVVQADPPPDLEPCWLSANDASDLVDLLSSFEN